MVLAELDLDFKEASDGTPSDLAEFTEKIRWTTSFFYLVENRRSFWTDDASGRALVRLFLRCTSASCLSQNETSFRWVCTWILLASKAFWMHTVRPWTSCSSWSGFAGCRISSRGEGRLRIEESRDLCGRAWESRNYTSGALGDDETWTSPGRQRSKNTGRWWLSRE